MFYQLNPFKFTLHNFEIHIKNYYDLKLKY